MRIAAPHGLSDYSLQMPSSPPRSNGSTEFDEGDRAKKRRKVGMLPSFADDDEMSLVELPGKENIDKRTQKQSSLAMPPPTLPDVQTSLMVEQARLYGNEKNGGSSGTNSATDHLSQDQGPQVAPCALIRSSGSATNINTQRKESNSQVAPNETNAIQKPLSQVEALPLVGENQAIQNNAAPVINNGSDEEFVEQPARPKKQRGRPRKTAAPDVSRAEAGAAMATDPADPPQTASSKKLTKPKKKRGRPKKSGRQDTKAERAAADVPVIGDPAPELNAAFHEKPEFEHHTATEHVDAGTVAPANPDVQGATKEAVAPRNDLENKDADIKDKSLLDAEVKRMTPQKQETPQEKKEAARAKPVPGPQSTGKPIYRVGLSKRSRIAPLLKVVRKE
ncbi:uncharacterized protein J7T54_005385 [Emericellopsis cladophorae]|uniref:AT hook domain-containing protein n=1 Tax=Emericellopsis cladophorae TaxID=2686198 RepID=A0A9P9XYL4_9HYPO|nr:uncharacterized protein J7T54_005385 [Emericellopsis cladophorae]KAI6780283.1 hypothetical protein J7T54_005385 [Emericellopsis cladophorae]